MKFFFTPWVVLFCFLSYRGVCQADEAVIRDNIVVVHNNDNGEVGAGFIIGLKNNKVLIVTASHVAGKSKAVEVQINNYNTLVADITGQNEYFDVALLEVKINSFKWKPLTYVTNIDPGDPVYILSVLQNKEKVPADGSGLVSDLDNHNLILKLRGVVGGDSGSPLLCKDGLVGMIYSKSPVQAVPISLIKKLVTEDWQCSWQLVEKSIYRAPIQQAPPPEINNEFIVPISAISVDGECSENIKNLTDNDTESYWSCVKDGWRSLLIHLGKVETVRKIKLYFPSNYGLDLPKGQIVIPELKKTFSLEKKLTDFVEKDADGTWYIYDLGTYYTIRDIKLTMRVKKDLATDVITELRLFEIKISGLKI